MKDTLWIYWAKNKFEAKRAIILKKLANLNYLLFKKNMAFMTWIID